LKETGGDQLDDQSRSLLQVRALLKMAEFAGAERILSGLKSTSSEVRYLKAMLAHGQRDFKRALTHYAAADVLADTEYLLAECYRESGDLDKATELFRKLLAQDSQSLRTWVGLICSSKSRDEMKSITCEYLMTIKPELENAGEVDQLLAKLNQSNPEPQAEGKKSTPQPTGARERDLKPRRRVRKILPADPFMKLVPADAPAKTDGLRILLLADFNIAGQMTRIMRALNRYTNHAARCVILEDDYLSYDRDLVLVDGDGRSDEAAHEEAAELARKADFYHIGRQPFALPGIDWNLVLRQNNTLFQYFGSYLRDNADHIRRLHAGRKFVAITAMEWTMYRALPNGFYHIQPYMIEPDELPQVDWQKAGPIRICHAPSNAYYRQIKGSDSIVEVMERLAKERNDVEIDLIENVSNAECLQRKRDCHLHLVALRYGFGLNAVESAALGMVPLVQLPNFVRAAYPDTPVQHVTATTLYDKTIELLSDRRQLAELGEACRQWAQREFSARNLIRKYWYLYDFIYHGLSVDYPHPFVEEFVVTTKQAVEVE
jgi:tetratricopeptide (TPR) repeat protein